MPWLCRRHLLHQHIPSVSSRIALSCPDVRSSRSCCGPRPPASSFRRARPRPEGKQGYHARKTLLGRHACSYLGVFVPACQSEPWVSRSRVVPLDLFRIPSAMRLAPSGARRKASPQAQEASPFFSRCNGLSAEKALLSPSIIFPTLRERDPGLLHRLRGQKTPVSIAALRFWRENRRCNQDRLLQSLCDLWCPRRILVNGGVFPMTIGLRRKNGRCNQDGLRWCLD